MNTNHRRKTRVFLVALLALSPLFTAFSPNAGLAAPADHLVINELAIDSVAGSGGTEDDWVELYNPTDQPVSLEGWTLQKFASSGSSGVKQALNGTVPAKSFFLVVRNNAATAQALKDKADLLAADAFSLAAGNIVYLTNNDTLVVPAGTNSQVVDFVGFGTAAFYEGAGAAPAIPETKSIARVSDGEDTDNNAADFVVRDTPTPQNSEDGGEGNRLNGTVSLTVVPASPAVRNLGVNGAEMVFFVNADAQARVEYGSSLPYSSATAPLAVSANTEQSISLANLVCGTEYHYRILAEAGGENVATADAVFTTLPCGIRLDALVMTRNNAKADGQYANGWAWQFDLTVWDLSETGLKMKFGPWSGPSALSAGNNMQYSLDGFSWVDIVSDNAYPATGLNISGVDRDPTAVGRQISVQVRMKVPIGTKIGLYDAGYGILVE